jgi:phosphatidylglycerophosphate synthase
LVGRDVKALPHALTGLRLLSAPLLWWLVNSLQLDAALICLAAAMLSDVVDGPLARRLGVASRTGAYFDVGADFAVIVAGFAAFVSIDVYPLWPLGLITLAFALFLSSSRLGPTIYDPVGRHIGGILFVAIGAVLAASDILMQQVILLTVTAALCLTVAARTAFAVAWIRRRAVAV